MEIRPPEKNATKKKNNRGQNATVLFCVSQMVIRSRITPQDSQMLPNAVISLSLSVL